MALTECRCNKIKPEESFRRFIIVCSLFLGLFCYMTEKTQTKVGLIYYISSLSRAPLLFLFVDLSLKLFYVKRH